jgi:hypothetical protein
LALWVRRTSYCFSHSRDLSFNPLTDTLINENGDEVKLDAPSGDELPPKDLMLKILDFKHQLQTVQFKFQ